VELDFASTIENCSAFMLVWSEQQEVLDMNPRDMFSR
jgi:hypothetical protein